jgi:hypothetical protein
VCVCVCVCTNSLMASMVQWSYDMYFCCNLKVLDGLNE